MAKPWYFQMMGAEIGPLTPAELMDRVKLGQVQPDTLVRSGSDGKWIPADRWKGLLPSKEVEVEPAPAPAKESSEPTSLGTKQETVERVNKIRLDDEDDPLYHLKGEAAPSGPVAYSHPDEYDFFQFVGFRHAISHPLYDAMVIYSHQHQKTVTHITRQAIAKFIGKPELGQDKPPAAPEPAKSEENAEPDETAAEK
jgi:hypothetical protein